MRDVAVAEVQASQETVLLQRLRQQREPLVANGVAAEIQVLQGKLTRAAQVQARVLLGGAAAGEGGGG